MDYVARIIEIIATNLEIPEEQLSADTNFLDDLDADSLDLMELAMTIEEEFGVQMEDERIPEMHTIADVAAELERLGA